MVDNSVRIIPFSDKSDEEFEIDQSTLTGEDFEDSLILVFSPT